MSRTVTQALGPFLALLAVIVLFAIVDSSISDSPSFLTLRNLRSTAAQAAPVLMAGIGMTLIIISGGIDLSVGNAAALAGMVLGLSLNRGDAPILAVAACLSLGIAAGAFNGTLIATLKLPPFIVTLGTMTIVFGAAKLSNEGQPIRPPVESIPHWMTTMLAPQQDAWYYFAPGVWLTLVCATVTGVLLRVTVWGRYVYAIGSNEKAARLSGVAVAWMKISIYAAAGVFFGAAGMFFFCRLTQGTPDVGLGFELQVIAAVVVGGTSLSGGRGSIVGTSCGTAIIAVVKSGCVLLNVPNALQDILLGLIVIVAAGIDRRRRMES
ncbi:MAG: ABC transporter permease [Pirellulales bacterium]